MPQDPSTTAGWPATGGGRPGGAVPPPASARPPQPAPLLVPASISLDALDPTSGLVTAVRRDLLLPQDASEATLKALAADLCASPLLAGREGDVRAALAASLAPFRGAAGGAAAAAKGRVALEVKASTHGVTLTDRIVVDLGAPTGAECAASLGAAIAGEAGLSDAVASAYAAAFSAAVAAARMGGPTLPLEAAKGWVPRVERA